MAVTQQLARVPVRYLAACRRSAGTSADGDPHWDPPPADVLDLDWAPAMLQRVCELAGLDDAHLDALRQATEGDSAIELAFLNTHPHAIGPFDRLPPPFAQLKWPASRNCLVTSTSPPSWPACRPKTPRPLP